MSHFSPTAAVNYFFNYFLMKGVLVTIGLTEHFEVMSVQIPLTEKKLTAEAVYRIKAGFDLREPFSVEIDPMTHAVHATMSAAKILSVEQLGQLTFHGDDALLNRISDKERAEIIDNLNGAAHAEAEKSGLKEDAQKQIEQRLKELLNKNGKSVQFEWLSLPAGK